MKVVTLFTIIGVILLGSLGSIGVCFAQTGSSVTSRLVTVKAEVPSKLEFGEIVVRWAAIDPTTKKSYEPFPKAGVDGEKVGDVLNDLLDLGVLGYDKVNGIYLASKCLVVRLTPVTSGRGYTVTQACTVSENLKPHFILDTGYQPEDEWQWGEGATLTKEEQGPLNAGETLGPATLADGKHTIFTSTTGRARMIRAYYGLATGKTTDPLGSKPITADTPAGQGKAEITFTLATNQ